MAIETNAFPSYTAVGNKEDFTDIIFNIDQEETPFSSRVKRINIHSTLHEWQTDSLASASTTAAEEGETESADSTTPTTLLNNRTHISKRSFRITNTQTAIESHGRGDEINYQSIQRGREILRDIEKVSLDNNAKVPASGGTSGETAGLVAWIKDNVSKGTSGGNPTGDGTDIRTVGTKRDFGESQIKDVMQQSHTNGAKPTLLLAKPFNRSNLSGFAGGNDSTRFVMMGENGGKISTSVKIYESDFGDLDIMTDIQLPTIGTTNVVVLVDPAMAALGFLRGIHTEELSKTGDSRMFVTRAEYALEVSNPKAHGIIADLKQS